ncbi:thiamine pyrophosphate-binding protein [Bradyrhizobium betae]
MVTLGDGINGVFGAMNLGPSARTAEIGFVQARHEEMAALHGVLLTRNSQASSASCIATSGPGASHLITGLDDARLDHQPVLAIAGQQARNALGGQYQQEIDLGSRCSSDVAGRYIHAGQPRLRKCDT